MTVTKYSVYSLFAAFIVMQFIVSRAICSLHGAFTTVILCITVLSLRFIVLLPVVCRTVAIELNSDFRAREIFR